MKMVFIRSLTLALALALAPLAALAQPSNPYQGVAPITVTGNKIACPTCGTGSGTISGGGTANHLVQWTGPLVIGNGDLSGDCVTVGTLATVCTKTNGVAFAPSATVDTTNAGNISSGLLPAARLPGPSAGTLGGVNSQGFLTHFFLTSIATNGAVTSAQPAASDISGLAASATTDTTNASNITSGTLPLAQTPNARSAICATWDSTTTVTSQTIEFPAPWTSYTVTQMMAATNGTSTPSFTAAAAINGTPITSLSAVTVNSSANTDTAATGANTGSANDQFTITISGISGSPNQAYVCLRINHTQQ